MILKGDKNEISSLLMNMDINNEVFWFIFMGLLESTRPLTELQRKRANPIVSTANAFRMFLPVFGSEHLANWLVRVFFDKQIEGNFDLERCSLLANRIRQNACLELLWFCSDEERCLSLTKFLFVELLNYSRISYFDEPLMR